MLSRNHRCLVVSSLLAACLLMLLDGCGFRLRGSGGVSVVLPATYLAGDSNSALLRELSQALKNTGTPLVDDKDQTELVLNVLSERRDRRALSVSAQGKVQEYQLLYLVQFDVRDKAGEPVLADQSVRATRNYSYQDTEVLAKGGEEEQLYSDMRRDAVQGIMRRLQALELQPVVKEPGTLSPDSGKIGKEVTSEISGETSKEITNNIKGEEAE